MIGAGRRLRKFFNGDLTDEMIWHEIIHEKRLHNIHQLKSLTQEAAKVLIQLERRLELLSLGITELPPEVAQELAQYRGEIILLNCIKELTPEAAAKIAQYRGFKLGLNGLKKISLQAIKALTAYKGMLFMDTLEDFGLTQKNKLDAEKIFKQFKTTKLCLNGIKTSSLQLLRIIAKCPGELELNGITRLSPSEAAVLVSHKGKYLKLKGLTVISAALARILIKYNGYIDISGAKTLDDEVIQLLAYRPEEYFLLHPAIKRQVDELKQKKVLEDKQKREALLQEQKKREKRKKEITQQARKLLKEFEEFDELELAPTEPVTRTEKITTLEEEEAKAAEERERTEARLNFEITKKKNRLNTLRRKDPDDLSQDEQQEITTLRQEIEALKDEIRKAMNLMIEEREVGTVVFSSSDDLVKYLKESGAEDDENNALANLDKFDQFDLLGSTDTDEAIQGDNFIITEM